MTYPSELTNDDPYSHPISHSLWNEVHLLQRATDIYSFDVIINFTHIVFFSLPLLCFQQMPFIFFSLSWINFHFCYLLLPLQHPAFNIIPAEKIYSFKASMLSSWSFMESSISDAFLIVSSHHNEWTIVGDFCSDEKMMVNKISEHSMWHKTIFLSHCSQVMHYACMHSLFTYVVRVASSNIIQWITFLQLQNEQNNVVGRECVTFDIDDANDTWLTALSFIRIPISRM